MRSSIAGKEKKSEIVGSVIWLAKQLGHSERGSASARRLRSVPVFLLLLLQIEARDRSAGTVLGASSGRPAMFSGVVVGLDPTWSLLLSKLFELHAKCIPC